MIRRVLMTGDTVGGVWTFTMELAEALGERGVEVVLAALGGRPTVEQRVEAARVPNLKLLASDYKLEWMEDPWADVTASGRWLLEVEREYAPDVVHLNSFGHGALRWSAPVVVTAHSCVLSWWRAVKGCAAPAEWSRYKKTVAASLRAADVVTAPSQQMAGSVAAHYGVERCRVIANGRSRRRFARAAKEPFVLTAGRVWDEAKNVAAVAEVAQKLPWPVYVAGEDRHPNGGRAEFPDCTMLGRLAADAMMGWFARASIYALPARYEPFGLSAVEAAHSGCALVLGDISSLREVWGDAALFVPPDDRTALAEAIGALIGDERLRARMARGASERARQYTPERMAAGYVEAYGSVAMQSMSELRSLGQKTRFSVPRGA